MKDILQSTELWKFTLPLIGAILAWVFNEWRKREWEQYQRKETNYVELIHCLRGFYVGTENSEKLKDDFLELLNKCWLYCPDNVINEGYKFLDTVKTGKNVSDQEKERALGDFVAAIRKDFLSRKLVRRTKFTGSDFRHLGLSRL